MEEIRKPALWDTLIVPKGGEHVRCVVIHLYASGRIKVRFDNGHLSVIRPEDVVANRGYLRNEATEGVLHILIGGQWQR